MKQLQDALQVFLLSYSQQYLHNWKWCFQNRPVHFHQEVHKRKDKYSRFVCCLHEIFIIREIWNFVTHEFFYHFMIIFQISRFEMKSVDIQRDNLLKAQFSFGSSFSIELWNKKFIHQISFKALEKHAGSVVNLFIHKRNSFLFFLWWLKF